MKKTLALLLLLTGLTLEAQGRTLTWTGGYEWNTQDATWVDEEGNPAVFKDGDNVQFFMHDFVSIIKLSGDLAPASMLFDNDSNNFEFGGTGNLSGNMQLTKTGDGILRINVSNDYWGGTNVLGGTIQMGDNSHDRAFGFGSVTLGDNTALNLGMNTIMCDSVIVNGNNVTIVCGETIACLLTVRAGQSLKLGSDLFHDHPLILGEGATINLNNYTFTHLTNPFVGITLEGSATIGNGAFNGDFAVASSNTLALCGNLSGSGNVTLRDNATINLNNHTLFKAVGLEGNNTIGNGSLSTNVTVKEGAQAHFSGETRITGAGAITVEEDATIVKALDPATTGLLKELSVSKGLIAGTDRQASLADGLYIESEADLMIESMTLTANNEIHVGEHTITLQDVTIKLSQTSYDIVDGVYYFNLSDLFHCSVDMADVTFDASDLTLPEGFNPETNGISFNLGDAKLTAETAERNLTLLMGGYGSRTMSLDGQGNPVFTKLVEAPEPTTGTLSMLALCALAARRRRMR